MSITPINTHRRSCLSLLFALVLPMGLTGVQSASARNVLHVPGDYDSIQEAVDGAESGDVIQVARGIFGENVLISGKSGIRLHGRNTLLDGAGSGIGIHVLDSEHIRIQGFVIQNYEAGIVLEGTTHSRVSNIETRVNDSADPTLRDGLQLVNSSHNVIRNVNAHGNGHNGFTLKGASTKNTLHGNRGNDNGQNPAVAGSNGGCGIQLISSGNDDNTIIANETLRNGWGIQIGGGSNGNEVAQNRSHENRRAGVVVLDPGMDNFIGQNNATGNGLADVAPSGSFDLFDQGDLDNTWRNNRGTANF